MLKTLSTCSQVLATLALLGSLVVIMQVSTLAQDATPAGATALVMDAAGNHIGVAGFTTTDDGTKIILAVSGLTPGLHGVHIHTNGSCEDSTNDQGQAVTFGGAGGHFDPNNTEHHGGPETLSEEGHAGDLPNIEVGEDGQGVLDVTTEKVTLEEGTLSILGRAIIIHANEDNYTDEPALGGSGPRVACGVIQTAVTAN